MLAECLLLTLALSQHLGTRNDFNEVHPGIGLQCESSPAGPMSAGVYKNSDRDVSVWAAKRWWITGGQEQGAWAELGIVTGYLTAPIQPLIRAGYSVGATEFFAAPLVEEWAGKPRPGLLVGVQFRF